MRFAAQPLALPVQVGFPTVGALALLLVGGSRSWAVLSAASLLTGGTADPKLMHKGV